MLNTYLLQKNVKLNLRIPKTLVILFQTFLKRLSLSLSRCYRHMCQRSIFYHISLVYTRISLVSKFFMPSFQLVLLCLTRIDISERKQHRIRLAYEFLLHCTIRQVMT